MVEQLTVNQLVTGSSPVRGAKSKVTSLTASGFFYCANIQDFLAYLLQSGTVPCKTNMKKLLTLALLVAGSSAAIAQEEHGAKWYADFDEAAAVAAETGRDMIVDFTGSDW